MKDSIKNLLGAAGVLVLLLFGYAAVSYVNSYASSIEPASYRSFSASGEGRVVAVPDVAQVTFTVITQGGTDIAKLQEENTKKVNGAIDFVKSKGVEAKDVQTASYQLEPRYTRYNCTSAISSDGTVRECPPPEIVGYTVTQSVTVKVRNFDNVGSILSGVVQNGANQVSGPTFTIDDPYALQNEARKQAIQRAQERARDIAQAGGFALGRLLGIDDMYSPYSDKYAYGRGGADSMTMGIALPEAAPAPAVEPGSQEVSVSVTLRYEIK